MSDIEIYVDNLAGNWNHNLNRYVSYVRDKVKSRGNLPDDDISMQTLANSLIDDDNYFGDLIENDIKAIAKDIRNEHKKIGILEMMSSLQTNCLTRWMN